MTYAARDARDAITRVMHEKGQNKNEWFCSMYGGVFASLAPLASLVLCFFFYFQNDRRDKKKGMKGR